MVDVFASEYGWRFNQILGHTLFQVKHLRDELENRKCQDAKQLADVVRTAYHADRHEYSRFLMSLEPQRKTKSGPKKKVPVPSGFAVKDG